MEGKRIKSAWEIALERADKLGQLTPEEQRKQNEEQFAPLGKGLADKLITGLPLKEIEYQLSKYDAEKRAYVERGLLHTLIDEFQLTDVDRAQHSLKAIQYFRGSAKVSQVIGGMEELLREQPGTIGETESPTGSEGMNPELAYLARKGISGTAVRPNPLAVENWTLDKGRYDTGKEHRLELLKEQLRKEV